MKIMSNPGFRILKYTISKDISYSALGDFEEIYKHILTEKGNIKAFIWLWIQVIKSLPPFVFDKTYWSMVMFKSYLKTALRNLRKYKLYSVINITGLTVGLVCVILILLYTRFEFSFDSYHDDYRRIFRIVSGESVNSLYILKTKILEEIPGVENSFCVRNMDIFRASFFTYKNIRFYEEKFFLADPEIFKIFKYTFIYGDPENCMGNPGSVVLTETTAKKYFGDEYPIGKILNYENRLPFTVTAVIRDIPVNSHFIFDVIASTDAKKYISGRDDRNSWNSWNYRTYLKLDKGTDISNVENRINDIYLQTMTNEDKEKSLFLQSVKDIHLYSNLRGEIGENGNIKSVCFYSAVGLIILMIACINFINLASAHSIKRCREVGIRKVLGANRSQLVKQFLGESLIYSFIALSPALVLAAYLLPIFNNLAQTNINLNQLLDFNIWFYLLCIPLIIGIISGSYPAIFTSAFQPVNSIKGEAVSRTRKFSLRNILVFIQFAVSIVFICFTLIILNQLDFIKNTNLGIDPKNIINIPLSEEMCKKHSLIKNEILKSPLISSVTCSNFLTSKRSIGHQGMEWEDMDENENNSMFWIRVDYDFIKTFNVELLQGRDFSKNISSDAGGGAYILNESAVRRIGWDNPIGKKFRMRSTVLPETGKVIGVMKDFFYRSFYHKLEPLMIYIDPEGPDTFDFLKSFYSIKYTGLNVPAALNHIRNSIEKVIPGQPFEYFFFEDDYKKVYASEEKTMQQFRIFGIIAILLASMGLFGITAFTVENRTKEIGIRKVFGASISNIVFLFSGGFMKILLMANIITIPLIIFYMNKWLQNFAYRINITIWFFVGTAVLTIIIAFITISLRTVKAALSNPVDTLRYE